MNVIDLNGQLVCVWCVCVCGWGRGSFSDVLQEETAVALCGFFSVPLTYKDRTAETKGEIQRNKRRVPVQTRCAGV